MCTRRRPDSLRAQSDHGILNHNGKEWASKDVYSQPCGCSCVAMHASVGFGSLLSTYLPYPPKNPKPGAHHNTTPPTNTSSTRRPATLHNWPCQNGVRPQNRPLVILIPPAHTHPAILPLGDGSLCHPRGCGVWAVGFLHGSYLGGGVGWRLSYCLLLSASTLSTSCTEQEKRYRECSSCTPYAACSPARVRPLDPSASQHLLSPDRAPVMMMMMTMIMDVVAFYACNGKLGDTAATQQLGTNACLPRSPASPACPV